VNDSGSSFHQFTRLEIILGRGLHGLLHSKINKITILHKNVAFKTTVTYTKEVIETWKRLQLACHRVFLNVSTTVIGAHHNGGLLFLHDH
jgi:hypothetical protein